MKANAQTIILMVVALLFGYIIGWSMGFGHAIDTALRVLENLDSDTILKLESFLSSK